MRKKSADTRYHSFVCLGWDGMEMRMGMGRGGEGRGGVGTDGRTRKKKTRKYKL